MLNFVNLAVLTDKAELGAMNKAFDHQAHTADICVVGGGMAGLIAAVAAARRGSRVVLIHDRPVLGGNASSEVRMWICGAHGPHKKETGILEEIQLLNRLRNPGGLYAAWDAVLFEFAKMTHGLTTLLNCTCNDGQMEDGHLTEVRAWQMTTQTWHTIRARHFIDCSGDSVLAPITGALVRTGREAREEFGESIAPSRADLKTMGNTLLLQLEETGSPQSFQPPRWAYSFDEESTLPSRLGDGFGHNFWWLELGGLQNTIRDAESIRDELMRAGWGVWDYMKNRGPQAEKLANWRLRWMGALPGKRENRRYVGPHILTQNDISAGGLFPDIVAYGGWSMDDHHPAGLLYPGKATLFHKAPSPYGIPFRSLFSSSVPNLFCAGRNISATHCALSSTRVMATCAIIGQAVGTAAALCSEIGKNPAELRSDEVSLLQTRLMEDDCWLPGLAKPIAEATRDAKISASTGVLTDALLDGHERPIDGNPHGVDAAVGTSFTLEWKSPRAIDCLRMVFDSDLNDVKRMPCRYKLDDAPLSMPASLVREYRIECRVGNRDWETLHEIRDNHRRLVVLPVHRETSAIRFTTEAAWGDVPARIFAIEASASPVPLSLDPPRGRSWSDVVADLPAADIAPPDNGLEEQSSGSGRVGA